MGERVIMNREILFKTKRKDWEELPKDQWWVEGDLLHMRYGDIVLINNFEDQLFRCDGNMVCQFTGLHDNTKWEILPKQKKNHFFPIGIIEKTEKIRLKIGVVGRFGRMILLNVIKEKKNVDYIKSFGEKSMLILGLCL